MRNKKISIITVSYNAVKTIEKTIKSVISQTYSNIEYIVVDGGSTDGTIEIIKRYEDKIAYWVSEPDKGIYDAMNKGIYLATGDIISIINADDYLENQSIEIISDLFKTEETDIICGSLNIIDLYGNHYATYVIKNKISCIKYKMCVFHPSCFVKREVYNKVGFFDIKYKIAGDYDFLLRAYNKGFKFLTISEVLANFRDGGSSNKNILKSILEMKRVRENNDYNRILSNIIFIEQLTKTYVLLLYRWMYKKILFFKWE